MQRFALKSLNAYVLALLLASAQMALAGHDHEGESALHLGDCALCFYGSAGMHAGATPHSDFTPAPYLPAETPAATSIIAPRRNHYSPRAPPAYP